MELARISKTIWKSKILHKLGILALFSMICTAFYLTVNIIGLTSLNSQLFIGIVVICGAFITFAVGGGYFELREGVGVLLILLFYFNLYACSAAIYNGLFDLQLNLLEFSRDFVCRHVCAIGFIYVVGSLTKSFMETLKHDYMLHRENSLSFDFTNFARTGYLIGKIICFVLFGYGYSVIFDPPFYMKELSIFVGVFSCPTYIFERKKLPTSHGLQSSYLNSFINYLSITALRILT